MKQADGNLGRAIYKSTPVTKFVNRLLNHTEHPQWCGYFTPSEIVSLCENGAHPNQQYCLEYAQINVKNGDSNPTWFYFTPGGLVKELLGKKGTK